MGTSKSSEPGNTYWKCYELKAYGLRFYAAKWLRNLSRAAFLMPPWYMALRPESLSYLKKDGRVVWGLSLFLVWQRLRILGTFFVWRSPHKYLDIPSQLPKSVVGVIKLLPYVWVSAFLSVTSTWPFHNTIVQHVHFGIYLKPVKCHGHWVFVKWNFKTVK